MISELSALITSSKAAYDIAKGINSLTIDVERNNAVSKILEMLLSVQVNAISVNAVAQKLQEEKNELTQKLMAFEKWSETEKQYDLKEIDPGVFVYVYKKTDNSSKPIHWLCPKCFQEKKSHILQFEWQSGEDRQHICSNCKSTFRTHSTTPKLSTSGSGGGPSGSPWAGL